MKISELIKALEAMKETFGDLPVYHVNTEMEIEVEINSVIRKDIHRYEIMDWEYEVPERIELDE